MMERRSFVKLSATVAGAAPGAPLLNTCARSIMHSSVPSKASVAPTQAATPPSPMPATPTSSLPLIATPTPSIRGRVVLVRTNDRAAGVRTAIDLLEMGTLGGQELFLKPNLNSADAFPGSTHMETLTVLVKLIQEQGPAKITIGDRSGMGGARAVMRQVGVDKLVSELGLDLVVFDELGSEGWVLFNPEGSHWSQGFALAGPPPLLGCGDPDLLLENPSLRRSFHALAQKFRGGGGQDHPR